MDTLGQRRIAGRPDGRLFVDARPVPHVTRSSLDGFVVRHVQEPAVQQLAEEPMRDTAPRQEIVVPTEQAVSTLEDDVQDHTDLLQDIQLQDIENHEAIDATQRQVPKLSAHAVRHKRGTTERLPSTGLSRFRVALRVAVLAVVAFGAGALIYKSHTAESANVLAAHTEAAVVDASYSPVSQSEVPPEGYLASYVVGPTLPRYISLPSLSLKARIIPVGVDSKGRPRTPAHSYDAGWYNVSSRPGEAGAAVISGMCTTPATNGLFDGVKSMSKGDTVVVERGDGVVVKYAIVSSENVPVDELDMAKVLRPVDVHAPGLNIVICSGTYNPKTNDMSGRFVIYAKQI